MKLKSILLYTLLLSGISYAQQGDGGNPIGLKAANGIKNIEVRHFNQPNIEALRLEDIETEKNGSAPWRFGYNNEVQLNLQNSGTWFELDNGDKVWLLKVVCDQALTVNLTFNETEIPEGNELYVYNDDKSFVLGKFTQYHLYNGELGGELVPGSSSIIEYYVPAKNKENIGNVQIYRVTHGYRTNDEFQKAFQSSGSCNMNVNCTDGAPWVNQRNGAVMLVSNSNGFCSGSLINNTLNDGKPYVLTANHCYSNPASWVFRFNWQADNCTNPGASPSFVSLSGAVLRARRTPSDFCLVEITGGLINNTVPLTYNPYFSGWDNSGTIPTSTVSIHHPSGDIKKISFDDDPAIITQAMGSSEANATWTVQWDRNTTTEGGSSGSPIFNQNHQIIGQLWGGQASCSNQTGNDHYGRVANSWNPTGSNQTNQLKHWLDPNSIGAQMIDGYDPNNTVPVALDAGVSNPSGASGTFCGTNISPQITIINSGTTVLTTATIQYGVDGNLTETYNWNGSLSQWQSELITLSPLSSAAGSHTFDATVTSPNSGTDENALNNNVSSTFNMVIGGDIVTLNLDLDCYASETSWQLTDAGNTVLYAGSGYADNTQGLLQVDFCLSDGCYNFKINDQYGDGMTGCSAAKGGSGSYQIVYNSVVLAEITEANANFGYSNTKNFCVDVNGIDEKTAEYLVNIYPNPAEDVLMIEALGEEDLEISLLSLSGQILSTEVLTNSSLKLDVSPFSQGVYLLKVRSGNSYQVKKVLIK